VPDVRRARVEGTFRGLLEAAPDAIVVVGRDGRIVLVNALAEQLFGYSRGELLGTPVEMLVPAARRDDHSRQRERYQEAPHRRPMGSGLELTGRRKDGSEFPVEISLSPVVTEDGPLITAAVRDVTARVVTERALKAANRELEAFTDSVSHDLRAPIRQIDGFARLLDEQVGADLDERARRHLDRIIEGATHMGALVDDLLNLARIGRQSLRPIQTSLDSVVAEVVSQLRVDQGERDIAWTIEPLGVVVCDPGLMTIAFTNLLSNAVKYTRPRERAEIEVGKREQNGVEVIMIRDNGVGFDMKYAEKLFGVFQRLHRSEEFEGLGVGLATVQRIVRRHGGDVWAEASPDEGAAFYVTLPPDGLRLNDR
jgi:PAS domain S-box-containing protein